MASPGQKHSVCGHLMAGFDSYSSCARCCDKGKGKDPCVGKPESTCKFCDILTCDQRAQLSTPSYKLKKEKREAKPGYRYIPVLSAPAEKKKKVEEKKPSA